MVGELDRAAGGADALGLDRVLDGDRKTVQRTDGVAASERVVGARGRVAGAIEVEGDDGVHHAVEPLDPIDERLEQVTTRDLAGPDRSGQLVCGGECGGVVHACSSR